MKSHFVLAAVATLFTAAPALAQDVTPVPPEATPSASFDVDGDSITIGAGGVYLPDYEGSNDYRFTAAPGAVGLYKGYSFTLAGNRASVDLIREGAGATWDFQAGPIGLVNFNRTSTKSIDDPRVKALGEIDTAIELGGYVGIGKTGVITSPYDKLSFTVSYRHDVSGVHESGILQPTISYFTPLSRKAAVALYVSGEHAGRGYARTYFSVLPSQVTASTLPVYNARAGWKNYTIGGVGTYALTGDLLHGFKLVAGGSYGRLLNDFGDSPITRIAGERGQWLGALGLAYTF